MWFVNSSSIAITEVGPSGRALTVSVYGSAGTLNVRGPNFDAALGLKSTFFTFGSGSSGSLGSGSSESNPNADASIPTGTGQVAGPVGPRIPVLSETGITSDSGDSGDSAGSRSGVVDGVDDVLFAQSDLLAAGEPSTGLSPDADLSPDDTLGADDSTSAEDGADTTTAAISTETSTQTPAAADTTASVDNPQSQAIGQKPSANPADRGASMVVMGGAATVMTAVAFSGLALLRRRRRA